MKRGKRVRDAGVRYLQLLPVLLMFCWVCTGCLCVSKETQREDGTYSTWEAMSGEAYDMAMDKFLTALENGDAATARSVFSPEALAADPQLDETLEELIALYSGPLEINERFGVGIDDAEMSYGKYRVVQDTTRFLRAGGTAYWCDFVMTPADDWNSDAVGVTCVRFYTMDAFCSLQAELWEREEDDDLGLSLYTGPEVDGEIRIVEMKPLIWNETATLDTGEVVAFLEGGDVAYDDFIARFGPPAAIWHGWITYYALPSGESQPRYLKLAINEATHKIEVASMEDDLEWIETIWSVSGDDER